MENKHRNTETPIVQTIRFKCTAKQKLLIFNLLEKLKFLDKILTKSFKSLHCAEKQATVHSQ